MQKPITFSSRSASWTKRSASARARPACAPDGAAAVAQLEQQRAHGLSHLVVPSASMWWLDHYAGLAERLPAPLHADADCLIFDLDAAA